MIATPPCRPLRLYDTHRLVPLAYSDVSSSPLKRIADSEEHLARIDELDALTNDQVWAESNRLAGIGIQELVFGVPHARIINGAFTFAHPLGSRFGGPERGAWYAGLAVETAQTEVAFHKSVQLEEIGIFYDEVTYVDYLADFDGKFHDLRNNPTFLPCLSPDSYVDSQELGQHLLNIGSLGLVYPSVRHTGGTCIACFRPAAVSYVRRGSSYRFSWNGQPAPTITAV
jgi:RES domain